MCWVFLWLNLLASLRTLTIFSRLFVFSFLMFWTLAHPNIYFLSPFLDFQKHFIVSHAWVGLHIEVPQSQNPLLPLFSLPITWVLQIPSHPMDVNLYVTSLRKACVGCAQLGLGSLCSSPRGAFTLLKYNFFVCELLSMHWMLREHKTTSSSLLHPWVLLALHVGQIRCSTYLPNEWIK